jgi:epoxyqueuosine reductase
MNDKSNMESIAKKIKAWGIGLGFNQVGISDINLESAKKPYFEWINSGFQGEMSYLNKHKALKFKPDSLVPQTIRIISTRLDYLPKENNTQKILQNKNKAYISRYALGRDYHKVVRGKLKKLTQKIQNEIKALPVNFRVFSDSAPVLEVEIAGKSGLGWRGKHTLLINKEHGSWFFLGEIYINLPLPIDKKVVNHCGICSACIDVCPTKAIIAPYHLDARKCISYLTIEHKGSIPIVFRKAIGNRIYGCDDCQLVCPWNKYGKITKEHDFMIRNNLHNLSLIESFEINESKFKKLFNGSTILRIGYEQWLRNIAIGLGNAPKSDRIISVLKSRLTNTTKLVREHIEWALEQHKN